MRRFSFAAVVLSAGLAFTPAALAAPLTPAFTYQGEIFKAGSPVTGTADLRFTLWDSAAGGVQIGALVTRNNVNVSGGVFTTTLDFGAAAFVEGEERYLQIELRSPAGAGAFTTLTTRQPITATPYAVNALSGAAPFLVKPQGSATQVVLAPSSGTQVQQYNFSGTFVGGLGINGSGSMLRTQNGSGGSTVLAGTSGDESGFIEQYTDTGAMAILFEAESSAYGQAGYMRLAGTPTGVSGGAIELTNNDFTTTLVATGGASSGGSTLSMFDEGVEGLRMFSDTGFPGGSIYTFDGNGSTQWALEPDFSGSGAFMIFGNDGVNGTGSIVMESSSGGSPAIYASGANSFFAVAGANSGDAAVSVANNAISSPEILDEPGLANNRVGSAGAVTVPTSLGSVLSRTITVPAAGYVLVLVDGDVALSHTSGSGNSYVEWVIDDVAGGFGSGADDMLHQIPSGAATGTYDFAVSSHAVYSVPAAGSYTYHLNMNEVGAGTATLFDAQLTVIYFPTAYGTVNPSFTGDDFRGGAYGNVGPTRPALSGAEIAAERAKSQADNMARMQAEMLAMKQEMAEMRAMMANNPNIKAQAAQNKTKAKKAPAGAAESNEVPVADADAVDAQVSGR